MSEENVVIKRKSRFTDNSHKTSAFDAALHMKNPCVKGHQMTMTCLEENGYDRSQCDKFYENYRNCKKFWAWIVAHRKKNGIHPHLPVPEDREAVKQEFVHLMKEV